MAGEVASAFVALLPTASGFGNRLQSEVGPQVDQAGRGLGSTFGKAFGALAALGIGAAVGDFLKGSVEEAREGQKVAAKTEAIIKATGGAANLTAAQVGDLATAISNKTGVDDEAIQTGANLLLTFKNVRDEVGRGNDVFSRATASAADLAAAGFGSIDSASKGLGKALNDPLKGITALSRAGVTFTEQQTSTIEKLVATGDILGAQKIILGEVESQVGGVAEASATAGEKAAVAFGNLKEQIGTALLPIIDRVANAFVAFAPKIASAIDGVGPLFARVGAFFSNAFGGGSGAGGALTSFASTIRANVVPVVQQAAATFTGTILPAVQRFAGFVRAEVIPVLVDIGRFIGTQVLPVLASLARFFYAQVIPAVVQIATTVATRLRPVFDALVEVIRGRIIPAATQLIAKFREYQPTIQRVIGVVTKVIGKVLEFAAAILGRVLPPLIRFASFIGGIVVSAISTAISIVARIISAVVKFGGALVDGVQKLARFAGAVGDKIGEAIDFIRDLPGKALDALGDLGRILFDKGKELIQGLIDGIRSMFGSIGSAMGDLGSKIGGFLPGSPVKEGPLTSWNGGGAGIRLVGMLVDGIDAARPRAAAAARRVAQDVADAFDPKAFDFLDGLRDAVTTTKLEAARAEVVRGVSRLAASVKKSLGKDGKNPVVTGFLESFAQGVDGAGPEVVKAGKDLLKKVRPVIERILRGGLSKRRAKALLRGLFDDLPKAITESGDAVTDAGNAAADAAKKALEAQLATLEGTRDDIKRTIESVKDAAASLSSNIADRFNADPFGAKDLEEFFFNLDTNVANLQAVTAAFDKLKGKVSEGFLQKLFESGNVDLITALADRPDLLAEADSLFGLAGQLADSLGDAVAEEVYADDLVAIQGQLLAIEAEIALLGPTIAAGINGAAAPVPTGAAAPQSTPPARPPRPPARTPARPDGNGRGRNNGGPRRRR